MAKKCIKCGDPLNKGRLYCSNQCRADATLKEINAKRQTAYPFDGKERQAYYVHKFGAKKRNIAWGFTFESWLTYWHDSGRWDQRGRRKGNYVMARKNDDGPYAEYNVGIITVEQNHRDAVNITRAHTNIKYNNPLLDLTYDHNK